MPKTKDEISEMPPNAESWLKKKGKPTTVFTEIAELEQKERDLDILDHDRIERERDVGSLLHQVVGRETR